METLLSGGSREMPASGCSGWAPWGGPCRCGPPGTVRGVPCSCSDFCFHGQYLLWGLPWGCSWASGFSRRWGAPGLGDGPPWEGRVVQVGDTKDDTCIGKLPPNQQQRSVKAMKERATATREGEGSMAFSR